MARSAVLQVEHHHQREFNDLSQRLQEQAQREIGHRNQVLQDRGMMIAELRSSEQQPRSHAEFLAQESRQLEA
eukprot:1276399-Amphidinium_carterae.1